MDKKDTAGKDNRVVAAPVRFSFDVALKLDPRGDPVDHEPVEQADLLDLQAELWLEQMRRGQPELALEDLLLRTLPVGAREDRPVCEGLLVEATGPSGETVSRHFGLDALAHVAVRGAARLLETGQLAKNQDYYFDLAVRREAEAYPGPVEQSSEVGGSFTVRQTPLAWLEHPLPLLLEQADAVGQVSGWSPIFYSHDVFIRANHCSRRGATMQPPVESGAVILGLPCSCPETGEFYLVATDVIELQETEQSTYSLSFSGRTWARIQEALRARQAWPAGRCLRLLGQAHGHCFEPCRLQGKSCRDCENRETCRLTSAFISDQDQLWTRTVFPRQPYAFAHIFGLDARGVQVHKQYAFLGGRMTERGFFLIPEIPASLSSGKAVDGMAGAHGREDQENGGKKQG